MTAVAPHRDPLTQALTAYEQEERRQLEAELEADLAVLEVAWRTDERRYRAALLERERRHRLEVFRREVRRELRRAR